MPTENLTRFTLSLPTLLGVTILLASASQILAAEKSTRPNIVLVMTDDQGIGDLSCHGNPILQTPAIDSFSNASTAIERFYVSPVCAPTRASLMTGRYAYRTGVVHTSRGGALMRGDEKTLAEYLSELGYQTGIFGKWHLGDNFPMRPQDQGFSRTLVHKSGGISQSPDPDNSYFDPTLYDDGHRVQKRGYCTDLFFDAAIDFIRDHHQQPFFVYLPTNTPHTPLQVDQSYAQPFMDQGVDDATAKIYGMIVNIDENFGRLLTALKEESVVDNTIVIFMTDNGANGKRFNAGFRDHKASIYEGGIRVPFFIRWPNGFPGGRKLDAMAAHIDLLPTLLAAAGGELDSKRTTDGRSLLPLLTTRTKIDHSRTFFLQCHRGNLPVRYHHAAIIDQQYKLLLYPGTFGKWGFEPSITQPTVELYDLLDDPGEKMNLVATKPGVVTQLRKRYDQWFDDVAAKCHPGRIALGHPAETPQVLSCYQDSQWQDNAPRGWLVTVDRDRTVDISVDDRFGIQSLTLTYNGEPLPAEPTPDSKLRVRLKAGDGVLHAIRTNSEQVQDRNLRYFNLLISPVDP
ncbi:MAG: arylsulfatase [Pirellulaceae bacterium]|nr:arylsulfatase [Pirellulaceae bacterium]